MDLYIPKPGERVLVTKVDPEDPYPANQAGDVLIVDFVAERSNGFVHVASDTQLAGTFCRVEPVAVPARAAPPAKASNPKDAVGIRKAPISTVPQAVIAEAGLALLEGARKYGRHNYRVVGVRASVYVDAAYRHLHLNWWDRGEDIDPDSGLSHVTKAIACLVVLRDSMLQGNWVDDRPPRSKASAKELDAKVGDIIDRVRPDDPEEAWTELRMHEGRGE